MKIGSEEFTPKYDNQKIWDIEESFGNTSISQIMLTIEACTFKELGIIIYHSISQEMSFKEFAEKILPNQYAEASIECGKAMDLAFGVKKK